MKKSIKSLSLILALCMLLSLSSFASGFSAFGGSEITTASTAAAPAASEEAPAASEESSAATPVAGDFAKVDETHWAGSSLTVKSVEYGAEFTDAGYVDSTLFTAVSKIIFDGGEIDVDYTKYTPILTVDGVQVDLYNAENASFTGDVQITLEEKGTSSSNNGAPFGADKAQSSFGPFYYSAAAYIEDGVYVESKSVPAAAISGTVSDAEINDLVVDSQGDYFAAAFINNADVVINNPVISLDGACGDDFNGWGAGIIVLGTSNVDINNGYIFGTGVLRSGLFTSGSAVVNVNDTVIVTKNDEDEIPYDTEDNYATPMMQQCPFGLGITGNIRASLACGAGCNNFVNSLVVSNGWAVLSTDSGKSGATALISNSTVAVVGEIVENEADADFTYEVADTSYNVKVGDYGETSGYIAYADSGVLDYAYGSAWYSPDYLGIITSGGIFMDENCYGYSERIAFLLHSGGNGSGTGTLSVANSSMDVQNIFAVTQLQGSYRTDVTIDTADIALAKSGQDILYLQINTDDNAGGPGETHNTITDLSYDEYLAQEVGTASGDPSELVIKNSTVQGNIYNAATSSAPAALNVTADAAELQGEVSAAWSYHIDEEGNPYDTTTFEQDYYEGTADGSSGSYDYTLYLRVAAQAAPVINNEVSLTLTNGSSWMVTGTNYLSSLTIDETSSISGMGLVMTVDGKETEIAAGTYTGEIIITAGDAPSRGEGDAELQAPVIGEAAQVAAAAAAAEEAAFEAELTIEPFNVDVGDGMVLEFSSVQFATGDGTITIFIPDTSKQIDCVVDGDSWTFADADFVDEAIIAAAKALYAENSSDAPAAAAEEAVPADDGTDMPAGFDESMNTGLDSSTYPHFDEYREYVAALALADSFMASQDGIPDDIYAAASPYIAPFSDINSVIGAQDYADWMAANYAGETFPTA